MDILLTEKTLRKFLNTKASTEEIVSSLCNSGPTVDRYHKKDDDVVFEIEIITNRIDSASAFGVAREANAILQQSNTESSLINNPYQKEPNNHDNLSSPPNFIIKNPESVKRFTAVNIDGVSVHDSTPEVISLLESINQRGVNNIVDVTNETTMLYGLPSHVFDKDKLALQELRVRQAVKGESITLLDNNKISLKDGDLVIEDGQGRLVDLCCIMGGQIAEVDKDTKNIVLILPICDSQKIRKTSLTHQKRTLASQIFEKGPDTEASLQILEIIAETIIQRAGGHISSKVFDFYPQKPTPKSVSIDLNWLSKFTGLEISPNEIKNILNNLGFEKIVLKDNLLTCQVPSFRINDINNHEDLAEEITRIYGYEKIAPTLPPLNQTPAPTDKIFSLEKKVRRILADTGYTEIYNNSLISELTIQKSGLEKETFLKLKNSLSEDYEYLRTSLLPSALQNHSNNRGKTINSIKLFEIANVYLPNKDLELPNEQSTLSISSSEDLLKTKTDLEKLFSLLNYKNISFIQPSKTTPSFINPQNSADIYLEETLVGYIAETSTQTSRQFELNSNPTLIEISLAALNTMSPNLSYTPVSIYPPIKEDITLESELSVGKVIETLYNLDKMIKKVTYKVSYQNKHTFEILIGADDKNLTQAEADSVKEKIISKFSN